MKEFIKQLLSVEDFIKKNRNKIISIDYNVHQEQMQLLISCDYLPEIFDELEIASYQVEVSEIKSENFSLEVHAEHEGVFFTSVMTKKDFNDFVAEWLYPPVTDETFVTDSPLTEQERAMKESGHKQSDFA